MTRIYIALALMLLMLAGGWYYGHTRYEAGETSVQAQWDADKATRDAVGATAQTAAAARALDWIDQFSAIGAQYEVNSHAQVPSVADSVATGVADGSIRLRGEGECPAVRPGDVSAATASSRAADAAATAALAQRTADSIAAVRVSDAADKREADFRALIEAQRAILRAERAPSK